MKGEHFIIDFWGVDESQCADIQLFTSIGKYIADLLEAKLIDVVSACFSEPKPGCSVLILLDKSHISFHTYSKEHVLAIDVFCCATEDIEQKVMPILKEHILYTSLKKSSISRM